MIRSATATWKGGPGAGEGSVSTSSGVITNALYSFGSSSGNDPCTSPCEMLAAATASCMSLMIAQEIAKLGVRPANVRTEAFLTLEDKRQKWAITSIELRIAAETSGIDVDNLRMACRHAKARCPISQVLDVPIKLTIQAATTEPQAVA